MEILVVIVLIFLILVLYVNIKVTRNIARSDAPTNSERVLSYLLVWFIPVLGVLFVPKKVLPELHGRPNGDGFIGGGGGSDGGCSGGDCG